jgi:hypothetical protein
MAEGIMATANLYCGGATNLFYEPEGLLLRCCLLPADDEHRRHLLTFQLGYLGSGEITVDIALEGGSAADLPTWAEPSIVAAHLCGADEADGGLPGPRTGSAPTSVNLSYVTVPDGPIQYRYTVWGQAGAESDDLRGQLSSVASGSVPDLTVTTRSGTTRTVPRAPRRAPRTDCSARTVAAR